MFRVVLFVILTAMFSFNGPAIAKDAPAKANKAKPATPATIAANAAFMKNAPVTDKRDFEEAARGFIATLDTPVIRDAEGKIAWDLNAFAFIDNETAPDTVNPSLWRHARLNMHHGLFKVTDGLYQIRGLDISNMTIVEGDTGIIVIDPLVSAEVARAALDLYYKHVPQPNNVNRPVKAVIYTHSHVDHFGGVRGIITQEDVEAGKVIVLAPEGFMEEAVSENVFAGTAMSRRANYMYGLLLPYNAKGRVDAGLGKATSKGTLTLIPPTDLVKQTGEARIFDGVVFEFIMAPDTEAPAEMLFYLPAKKALSPSEDTSHTLHNLYTLRGAKVRDAYKWWRALDETITRYGDDAEVVFMMHTWPTWGNENVLDFLKGQRDGYKYIHDQTLRLANLGYTPAEISEQLAFPPSLQQKWHLHGYYGTVSHNAKAVYQHYLGWFDGNPANLEPHPPVEAAKRYVEFMGGAAAVIKKARACHDKGDYRWVAEVLKHVVFADPNNTEARYLQADALEQLGYQAESGPWRGFYLTGAQELRKGMDTTNTSSTTSEDMLNAMSPEMILDYMAVHLNGPRADNTKLVVNWTLPENADGFTLIVENSVLLYRPGHSKKATATLTMPSQVLAALIGGAVTLDKAAAAGLLRIEGKKESVTDLFGLLDVFAPVFPIVTP